MFDVPDLDAMSNEELRDLDRVLVRLAIISDAMIRARALYRDGDHEAGRSFETCIEHWIKLLPAWARWRGPKEVSTNSPDKVRQLECLVKICLNWCGCNNGVVTIRGGGGPRGGTTHECARCREVRAALRGEWNP